MLGAEGQNLCANLQFAIALSGWNFKASLLYAFRTCIIESISSSFLSSGWTMNEVCSQPWTLHTEWIFYDE